MLRAIFLVFELVFILGLSASVFLGRQFWPLDLLSFFWSLFILAAVLVLLVSLAFSGPVVKIAAVIALAIALVPFFLLPKAPATSEARNLRLITANLFIGNPDPREFAALLVKEQPDIVVTQETNVVFQDAIRKSGLFPFETSRDLPSRDDKKVFSRFPIREEAQLGPPMVGNVVLQRHPMRLVIDTPQGPLVLYAAHPDSPRRPWRWQQRNMYLDVLAEEIAKEPKVMPVVAVGDWNTPPWSAYFRAFFTRTGFGSMQSRPWPETTRFLERFQRYFIFGAAIDHAALSPQVSLVNWQVGPNFGSNHLPVIIDLALPQTASIALAGKK